jgi:hypothetical protein
MKKYSFDYEIERELSRARYWNAFLSGAIFAALLALALVATAGFAKGALPLPWANTGSVVDPAFHYVPAGNEWNSPNEDGLISF